VQETGAKPIIPIEARYRPLLELGRGGTARVFLAASLVSGLKKLVVLKTLEPELSMNVEMRELFRREAEVCARLNHPNIVQVQEVIEQSTGPVIVMEYLEGIALSQIFGECKESSAKRLYLHAITQLLAGLQYFHELKDYDRTTALNPVHRDISPQNVIVLFEGAVKVLDFGIAKLANEEQATRTGIIKGKLHYMPAEQLLGDTTIDRRADLFSAGVMIWEALAGRRMWSGHSENSILQALIHGTLPNLRDITPGFPEYFYEIVAKAVAHSPDARYATALELQLDVERMLGDLGGQVHPREISEFMRTQFGSRRQEQEAAIERATRHPSSITLGTGTPFEVLAGGLTQDSRSNGASLSRSETLTAVTPGRRVGFAIGAGVLVLALAAVFALGKRTTLPDHTLSADQIAAEAPAEVSFSISSSPVGALVLLDGSPLGRTPWVGTLPAKKQTATLELRAENFEPVSKIVSLVEDLNLDVNLRPLAPAAPTSDDASTKRKPGARAKGSLAQRAPLAASSGKPVTSAKCNPPYTLGADGIRTYKAECF